MKRINYLIITILVLFVNATVFAYNEYKIGDEVIYNNVNYYVIKDSSSDEDSVLLIKAEPLTVEEINIYGVGHINKYSLYSVGTVIDYNGYGSIAYYSSETCGYVNGNSIDSGCTTSYVQSDIKYVVDAWQAEQAPLATGTRLLTYDELFDNLGFERWNPNTQMGSPTQETPNFMKEVISRMYSFWTMSSWGDSTSNVCIIYVPANMDGNKVYSTNLVRPVINLKKISLGDSDESIIDDEKDIVAEEIDKIHEIVKEDNVKNNKTDTKNNNSSIIVKAPNTYMRDSLIIIILGFIISAVSIVIFFIIKNKKGCKK